MRKFNSWFINLNFRNKITFICVIVSLVPVIMLGSYSYNQIRTLLINREKEVLTESLNQAVNTLEYITDSYINVMNYIIFDDDLKTALNLEYNNNYEMYLSYRDVIDPLFMTVCSLHNEIDGITIYSNNNIHPHGDILRPLSDIDSYDWFHQTLDSSAPNFVVSASDHQLNLVWNQYGFSNQYTNIIKINLNFDHTFGHLSTLFDDSYGIIIVDENQDLVYSFQSFKAEETNYVLSQEELLEKIDTNAFAQDYVYKTKNISNSKWTAYLYRPIRTISAAANRMTVIVFIIIIACTIFLFFASYFLSKVIVRPLEKLYANMKQIESGDLTVTVTHESTDEIGHLIKRFRKMVNRLKYLIDEVYKSKITQQKYEMKALQAQICPHFFYNSLSLINSKAILADHQDISLMAQFLSSFYRTTLNNGKNTISVKDEWTNVTSYIQIQCLMHDGSFDVSYDIDDDILDYTMLNLLLQPIVENAIVHGLDHRESSGRGLLTISGKESHNNLLFTVTDNGCGIPPDVLENILTTETSGYGIKNVHRRVQLHYGQEYGLSYKSILGEETTVYLTIPRV